MPTRSLAFASSLHRRLPHAVLALALLSPLARPARLGAQLIQIKTLPLVDGEQWRLFPSANSGIGGLSIALRDSLLDPFENPAKGSRISTGSRGFFFGSPSFYSVSKQAGGGRTLPIGGIGRMGSTFGGFVVALQQIDDARPAQTILPPVFDLAPNGVPTPSVVTPASGPSRNGFAFGTIGRVFERAGISLGASGMWSGLNHIDGVDVLYAGSQTIDQHGSAFNVRLGALKEWAGERTLEALVLHDRFGMTHDVTWADQAWDPNERRFKQIARREQNNDRTRTWGLHLAYTQPFADSGWRIGASLTTNLMSHPKLPNYQLAQGMTIPWDPGRSGAYDIGVGIGKASGLTRFGIDAIFEPIRSHTWGKSPDSIVTTFGTLPAGSKSTENWFRFANAIVRTGVARELPMDSMRVALKSLRLEGGLALRSIAYTLNQHNHATRNDRRQTEDWLEWTRTWGLGIRFTDLEVRYNGRTTTGTGRPGVFSSGDIVFAPTAGIGRTSGSAASGPITLTGVAVTTHQLSVSIPVR